MRNPKINFDELQMFFGEPYVIDIEQIEGTITIYQPTIGDIVSIGEDKFYQTLSIFVTNTTTYRLMLWDAGMDWNNTSDFELFLMLYKSIDSDVSLMLFGVDLSICEVYTLTQNAGTENETQEPVLVYNDEIAQIIINETVYNHISQYLQNVFQMFPEEKLTKDPVMKMWFIERDRRQAAREERKKNKETFSMRSIISACVNHPGFKYNLKQLKEVGVCEFYDSVRRLQIYENSTALLKGMYSGFVDGSKIKPDDYNFMK